MPGSDSSHMGLGSDVEAELPERGGVGKRLDLGQWRRLRHFGVDHGAGGVGVSGGGVKGEVADV